MDFLSPDTSSFLTFLPYDIPSQGPTSVSTSIHRNSISDLPSTMKSSFPSNISSEKPISDPPSAPSEYQSAKSSISSLPSSMLPYIAPSQDPPGKTCPYTSYPPSFLLSVTPSVISVTSLSYMPSLFPTPITSELPTGSPSTDPAPSWLPTQVTSNNPPDKTIPDTSSMPVFPLSAAPNVITNTYPLVPCLLPTSVPYETPIGSPSPGPKTSRFLSLATSNDPPDKTDPDTSSPLSMILTVTTATTIKKFYSISFHGPKFHYSRNTSSSSPHFYCFFSVSHHIFLAQCFHFYLPYW